jgi:secreted trypsin-like serine protease
MNKVELVLMSSMALVACEGNDAGGVAALRTNDIVGGRLEAGVPAVGYLLVANSPAEPVGPYCGATLIAPDVAVTAAHCVRGHDTFAVGFGEAGSAAPIRVVKTMRHPEYPGGGFRHDVAVLVLESNAGIAALEIAPPQVGAFARFIGYGRTTEGPKGAPGGWTYERKQETEEIVGADMLDVWTHGVDGGTCFGDSGGPLLTGDDHPAIIGVLWGSPPEEDVLCTPGTTRVFTSLSGERGFIDRAIACKASTDPTCLWR